MWSAQVQLYVGVVAGSIDHERIISYFFFFFTALVLRFSMLILDIVFVRHLECTSRECAGG